MQRKAFRFEEVPCKMRPRTTGRSSITALRSIYYIVHVLLGVFVNVLKYDRRARRREIAMERLLNVMTAVSVLLAVLVLVSVRRAHIRVEYSVSWLAAAMALLALSRARFLLDLIARYLGISYAPLALLLVIGGVFLIMFFRFSVIISKLRDDNIALAQRVAILEYHIQSLREDR